HQLGLRLDGLRELDLQRLGDALMVLLTGAPQQRLIRHVLDERMLERVGGLQAAPPAGTGTPLPPTGAVPGARSPRPTGPRLAAARRKTRAPVSPRVVPGPSPPRGGQAAP